MVRDVALTGAAERRDAANNADLTALVNDVTDAEDTFVADETGAADALVSSVFAIQRSGVASLSTVVTLAVNAWASSEGTNYAD